MSLSVLEFWEVQLDPPILRLTQFATIEFEFFAEFDREKINCHEYAPKDWKS